MIKNNDDKKTTPKRKAQDLIMDALATAQGYWEESYESDGMTKREIQLINVQLKKECDKIAKKVGYNESWVG